MTRLGGRRLQSGVKRGLMSFLFKALVVLTLLVKLVFTDPLLARWLGFHVCLLATM